VPKSSHKKAFKKMEKDHTTMDGNVVPIEKRWDFKCISFYQLYVFTLKVQGRNQGNIKRRKHIFFAVLL